jgi:hypothetical protein
MMSTRHGPSAHQRISSPRGMFHAIRLWSILEELAARAVVPLLAA